MQKKRYELRMSEIESDYVYDLSENGQIDSEKYSLLELLFEGHNVHLSIDDRIDALNSWLEDNKINDNPIFRKILESGNSTSVKIRNLKNRKIESFINFSSNNYLNLNNHPEVVKAAKAAIDKYGAGICASAALIGTTRLHKELEDTIARKHGCQAALVQSSGYGTNIGVVKSLLQKKDVAIFDMYAHASLIDGVKESNVQSVFFLHNDIDHLEHILKKVQNKYVNKLVVVDGVYSMDGDMAPVDKIVDLCKKYGAKLLVDDAHGTGVVGKKGNGVLEHFGMEGKVDIVTGTFSKALGSVGGFVTGSTKLINYLRCANRAFVFSSAAFPAAVATALKSLEIIEKHPEIRTLLWEKIRYFKESLKNIGFDVSNTESAIMPITVGSVETLMGMAIDLQKNGILVTPVFFPAVPKNKSRLRFTMTTNITFKQIDKTVSILKKLKKKYNIVQPI